MNGLLATLALLVASGGVRLFLPTVANGLEWIGAADVMHASCRIETMRRAPASSEPEGWSPWVIMNVRDYDSEGRGVYGIVYHTTYTSTGWTDYYHGLPVRSNVDIESDGIVDVIGLNVYDAHNNHVLRHGYEYGELSFVHRRFFDHDDRLIREEFDHDGDGIVDARSTREYGAIGEVLRDTYEYLRSDQRQVYEHSYADGLISATRYNFFQAGGYLSSEAEVHYEFDEHDRLIRMHGVAEHISTEDMFESVITYEYDDRGNFVYYTDHDVTRSHFSNVRYVYDERGFLTDRYSQNYLGGGTHTRHIYEGCQVPLINVKVEISTAVGVVPPKP